MYCREPGPSGAHAFWCLGWRALTSHWLERRMSQGVQGQLRCSHGRRLNPTRIVPLGTGLSEVGMLQLEDVTPRKGFDQSQHRKGAWFCVHV